MLIGHGAFLGAKFCRRCTDQAGKHLKDSHRALRTTTEHNARYRCLREAAVLGDTADEAEAGWDAVNKAMSDTEGWIDWTKFRDIYAKGVTRTGRSPTEESHRGVSPFMPSVDGILPFIRRAERRAGYQTAGNIGTTSYWANIVKQVWPAGLLAVVRDWVAIDSPKTLEQRQAFLDLLQRVHEVSCTIPYRQASRLGSELSSRKAAQLREEYRTLRPSRQTQKLKALMKRWKPSVCNLPKPEENWRPKKEADITENYVKVIEEDWLKEGKIPRKLRRGKGGALFPFEESEMPEGWSWWLAMTSFSDRFVGMWLPR